MSLSWPVPVNSLPNPLNKPVTGRTLWSSSPVYMLVPNSHLCCFQSWGQSYFQRHPSLHLHLESMLVSEQSQKAVSFIVSDLFLTGSFNKKKMPIYHRIWMKLLSSDSSHIWCREKKVNWVITRSDNNHNVAESGAKNGH